MNVKKAVFFIAILLISITSYGLLTRKNPQNDSSIKALVMVNRHVSSSDLHSIVTITDEMLNEYPVLREAFEIEFLSDAVGKGRSTEWVICTQEERILLEDLIKSLPSIGEGTIRLEYLGIEYMIEILYEEDPSIIG